MQKWEYCAVPICSETSDCQGKITEGIFSKVYKKNNIFEDIHLNEVQKDQIDCGKNQCKQSRIINGYDAREAINPGLIREIPHQIRIRYISKQQIAGKFTDHQCGGTLIR